MKRRPAHTTNLRLLASALLLGLAAASARAGTVRVRLEDPTEHRTLTAGEDPVAIHGRAEILGGALDVFLVLDTSRSLRRTDPGKQLVAGARALAVNLLALGRTRVGVVDFDAKGHVIAPLTSQEDRISEALGTLDQKGKSNLASGIRAALRGLAEDGAPGSTRVVLLFTDGLSDDGAVLHAAAAAREQGVAVHTVLLGFETRGASLLQRVASETRGTFLRMTDPSRLSAAFLGLRATGVDVVTLALNGGEPVPAQIAGARFEGRLRLAAGENRIVARAHAPDGTVAEEVLTVSVRPPGCAELALRATRNGSETASLSQRSVEIVLDASNSMWGRLEGRPKLEAARRAVEDLVSALPSDLRIGLRAYGHRHAYAQHRCDDSELLVPLSAGDRAPIRDAMADLEPRGQTPLAFSLAQVARDFGTLRAERAVVLVTDGIESCGGDPVAAARDLQADGPLPIHVIGFGLASDEDEDTVGLRAIAEQSGGRFLTARSARELRAALAGTVGTAFHVLRDGREVAEGTLGRDAALRVQPGDYTVQVEGDPPFSQAVQVEGGERLVVTIEVEGEHAAAVLQRVPTGYTACDAQAPSPAAAGAGAGAR